VVLVAAGLIGALAGGWLGDRALQRWTGGHLLVGAVALVGCAPCIAAMPFLPVTGQVLLAGFAALLLLSVSAGPVNAVLVGCVPASLRSAAVSLNTFSMHLFGDAASPYVLGRVSDGTGLRVATALTAIPVLVGGLVLAWGALRVNRDPQGIRRFTG
jgi:predicted MFS family arabinose efflux permease